MFILDGNTQERQACAGHWWISSGGTPRLVNVLAAKCLLVAFGQGSKAIHAQHVEKAAADTESIQQPIAWHERLKLVIGL